MEGAGEVKDIMPPGFDACVLQVVESRILEVLNTKWANHPVTTDTRARMELEQAGRMKDRITACVSVYKGALEGAESPSPALFHLAVSTLQDLPSLAPACAPLILTNMINLLNFGKQHSLLEIQEYEFWLKLIHVEGNKKETVSLVQHALARFPGHLEFWLVKLGLDIGPRSMEFKKTMTQAREALKVQVSFFYNLKKNFFGGGKK